MSGPGLEQEHDEKEAAEPLAGILRRCMTGGLVGGEGFAIDPSVVKADVNAAHALPGESDVDWKSDGRATRAVREYLEALDEGNALVGLPPKSISLTDPCARWTAATGGPAFFAYSTNYLVDVQY